MVEAEQGNLEPLQRLKTRPIERFLGIFLSWEEMLAHRHRG